MQNQKAVTPFFPSKQLLPLCSGGGGISPLAAQAVALVLCLKLHLEFPRNNKSSVKKKELFANVKYFVRIHASLAGKGLFISGYKQ